MDGDFCAVQFGVDLACAGGPAVAAVAAARKDMGAMDLREQLAAKQHEIWAHWMEYLFSVSFEMSDGSFVIGAKNVERWQRQIATDYADLSEKEKESDRHQADKILTVLGDVFTASEVSLEVGRVLEAVAELYEMDAKDEADMDELVDVIQEIVQAYDDMLD